MEKETKTIMGQLSEPLTKGDVEFRVGSCFAGGFTLLLYKTARTDVIRLNKVCGTKWRNKHFYDAQHLLCCELEIYDSELKEWVGRSDVGTESFTEKEKGSYSDSFKRAGFRWGIGIELYNSPFIFLKWTMEKDGNKYKPVKFYPSNIEITEYKVINETPYLTIAYEGKKVFSNIEDLPKDAEPNGALSVNDTGLKKKEGIEINARINKMLDEAQSLEDLKIIWVENTQDLNRLKLAGIEYYEPLEKRKNELKTAFEVYAKEGE